MGYYPNYINLIQDKRQNNSVQFNKQVKTPYKTIPNFKQEHFKLQNATLIKTNQRINSKQLENPRHQSTKSGAGKLVNVTTICRRISNVFLQPWINFHSWMIITTEV